MSKKKSNNEEEPFLQGQTPFESAQLHQSKSSSLNLLDSDAGIELAPIKEENKDAHKKEEDIWHY